MGLDILGIREVAEVIGRTEGATTMLAKRGRLPKPDAMVNGGTTKVWYRSTIERWQIKEEQG